MRRFRDPRTGPFERAFRTSELSVATDLLNDRHAYWSRALLQRESEKDEAWPEDHDLKGWVRIDRSPTVQFVVAVIAITAMVLFLHPVSMLLFVVVGLEVLKHYLKARARKNPANRLLESKLDLYSRIRRGQCLDCAYDLTGCPNELRIESDHPIGPRLCPECASFWPRLPEPTPDEMHRWHKAWFRR